MEKTMTLYEALEKKKILEKKVEQYRYNQPRLVDIKKTYDDVNDKGVAIDDIKKAIQSGRDAYCAVVYNLNELKAAINEANAKIHVIIAGKEYSIANAISRLRSIDVEVEMYTRMLTNIRACENEIENASTNLSSEAVSKYVSRILGDSKKDEGTIKALKEQYIKDNTLELYDPLNTRELASTKLDELAAFKEQIHFALTKANCENTITVNFSD